MMESQNCSLTRRERESIILAARGLSNKEIANLFGTSVDAVKAFFYRACVKLGARNRNHAIILTLKRNIIPPCDIYSLDEIADLLAPLGADAVERIASIVKRKTTETPLTSLKQPHDSSQCQNLADSLALSR